MPKNYTDITLENHIGGSEVAAIDSETVVVSSWLGNLSVVDLKSMQIVKQNFVGSDYGCCTLRSLQTPLAFANEDESPIDPSCAVATQGGYGVFWDLKQPEAKKFYPDSDGSVSCVAYIPTKDLIALGIGSYPLSDERKYAYLELWSIESEQFLLKVALPGTCVDAISFSPDGSEIICTTGLRNQQQGFVIRIETETLRLLQIIEIPYARCQQVQFDNRYGCENYIYWSSTEVFVAFELEGKRQLWSLEKPDTKFSLHFDADEHEDKLFLSDGQLADSSDGAVIKKLKSLDSCCAVTVLPNNKGYVGISRSGVLRHWKPVIS